MIDDNELYLSLLDSLYQLEYKRRNLIIEVPHKDKPKYPSKEYKEWIKGAFNEEKSNVSLWHETRSN